ncbi:SDR family oxidoreductase [Glaciibacter psychrotolerans]|uniref:NAD(P)-dependent dehydrogenase (Short-subunit alcohol dehydrogenase family) n=1 Tax=Glaciibacter psychrotolerans TaxID=670054 RepID=A0A7Z0EFE5_9MICO|nr:NAD(P)-dependent dehydrogenase (short-subunit alcohol dehydrogenase family) [Leifsonia psychrotolerans]
MSQQRIVVTGAASGIGAEVVRQARLAGALVAAVDRVPVTEAAASVSGYVCDVTDAAAVNQAMAAISEHWGAPPTALVHCAGMYCSTPTENLAVEDWDRLLAVNARGTFLMAQAVGRAMLAAGIDESAVARGGSIVLLTSVASDRGDAFEPGVHYSASKGAVISLTRQLAAEWGPRGIRTNAVSPGVIDTPMTTLTQHPAETEAFLARVPLGRLGRAAEVAATCLFLVGPTATYINGVVLPVDGGILVS